MVDAIASIARRQLGLVTRSQLLQAGFVSEQIWRLLARGRLERIHPGVYRIAGYPPFWDQTLMAALLAAGKAAFVSFEAAGAHWALDAVVADRPHITVVHAQVARIDGVVVHRTRLLAPGDVLKRGPLRVASPYRTLIDLAASLPLPQLEDALDAALRQNLVSVAPLLKRLDIRGRRGVRGTGGLERLLEARRGQRKKASTLQNRFRRGLAASGLPMPLEEYQIFDRKGRFVARVDFAYPDIKVYIEVDGSHHEMRKHRQADMRRQNRLSREGWVPLRYDRDDVNKRSYVSEIGALFRTG